MGTQFTPNSIPRNIIIIMKFLAGLALAAAASAVPIELTPEVAMATKDHLAAHAAAMKGEHAALAPVQGPAFYLADAADVAAAKPYLADTAEVAPKPYLADAADVAAAKPYLADTADVAAAKVEFKKYFDAAAAGTPLTPVTVPVANVVVPKVEPVKVAAPVVSYTVPTAYYGGYYPYHYSYPYHYAAYPYFTGLPVVSAPAVAAEAKEAVAME